MSELPPGPLPASELAAAEDDGLPSWPLPAPRVETAEDIRYERTFYRGALLRRIRTFARENGSLAAMFSVVFVNLVGFGIVVPLIP
ncbi:MAG: MFS transporter, partial [Asticcacaulis sp.]